MTNSTVAWHPAGGAPSLLEDPRDLSRGEQMLSAVNRLERFHRLVSVVHVRATGSPVVAAWHDQFHAVADALLTDGFRKAGVYEPDLPAASRIGTFVIEGLLTHAQDAAARNAVLGLLAPSAAPD